MVKKFICWFVFFGLSFLLSALLGGQGKAFFIIHLGFSIIFIFSILATIAGIGSKTIFSPFTDAITFIGTVMTFVYLAITVFATWAATKLFGIDFFVAYQIMTFGQCLCRSSSSSKKNDL